MTFGWAVQIDTSTGALGDIHFFYKGESICGNLRYNPRLASELSASVADIMLLSRRPVDLLCLQAFLSRGYDVLR